MSISKQIDSFSPELINKILDDKKTPCEGDKFTNENCSHFDGQDRLASQIVAPGIPLPRRLKYQAVLRLWQYPRTNLG